MMTTIQSPFDASVLLLARAEELLAGRKLSPALHAFQCAQAHGADAARCAAGRWMVHALRGDYSAAGCESAAISASGLDDENCLWRGEEIAGKRLIVRCLHGSGDAVHFLRYAPQLKARAARVVWQVAPELLRIARCFRGVDQVVSWESRQPCARSWDVQAEIMELPRIFETSSADLPIATNYLRLPTSVTSPVASRMGRKKLPRVGVVWAAGEWNPSRSIPFRLFRRVLRTTGCEIWNLQGGTARRETGGFASGLLMRDADECGSGILPLAAVIQQLDLVITVDTLAAHLAGALGVPAWVLLQYAADWRWMTERNDSPWYPSLRLFRQPVQGEWCSVLREVETSLQELLGSPVEKLAA